MKENQPADRFATTHWSVVLTAGRTEQAAAAAALEQLAWNIGSGYSFIRRKANDPHQAEDLPRGSSHGCWICALGNLALMRSIIPHGCGCEVMGQDDSKKEVGRISVKGIAALVRSRLKSRKGRSRPGREVGCRFDGCSVSVWIDGRPPMV